MPPDKRARVLIADADAGLRHGLNQRLIDAEVSADIVSEGKEAIEKLNASSYAVVVLDLGLPQAGAERILDLIGAKPREMRPVVLVTAASSAARSLDVDVVQIVLRKPCDLAQLSEIVQSCVRSADTASQRDGEQPDARDPIVRRSP